MKRNHEDMKLTLTPTATVAARLTASGSENEESRHGEFVTERNTYMEARHSNAMNREWRSCDEEDDMGDNQSCGRDEDTQQT